MQLKGGGQTAFSRFADGRAVLRSTMREFLCQRSDGRARHPDDARARDGRRRRAGDARAHRDAPRRVIRVAPSFVRFGSFEIFTARKEHEAVKTLADYVIDALLPGMPATGDDRYARFFDDRGRAHRAC